MKKFILLSIFAFTLLALFPQSLTVSYVNGYKILTGERPDINIRDFPADSYEQGKIKIKLDKSYETKLPDIIYRAGSQEFVTTGISALDMLNSQFKATSYTPLFGMLYETNSRSNDFRERHRAWGFHLWFTIDFENDVSIIDAVEAYQSLSFVEVAEPFYKTVLYDAEKMERWSSNDPQLGNQWHYNNTGQAGGTPGCDISLFNAWEIEKGNNNVIVSVVDCGINVNHPDLQANIWSGVGYNFWQNTSTISPGDHGCHTGGTISAVTNNGVGVAGIAGGSGNGDGVRLMTCQVFNPQGNSGGGFQNAYIYAADNGACISQNSWGYTSPGGSEQAVLNAIDYFIANGGGDVMQDGIVIFASGNNNTGGNGLEGNYYPGCYPPVLGVTATNVQDKKSYYAHYGTWVGLSAPGGETNAVNQRGVLSCTTNSYAYFQGTSMACPHVSGTAALLVSNAISQGYKLSNQEIKDLLKNNADDHYALNPSYIGKLGTGRLNAYKALLALQEVIFIIYNPENVSASPLNYSEIEINWQKNENNEDVILVFSMEDEIGSLKNGTLYQIGDILPDGGEVIYIGDAETFIHSELDPGTKYYYKLFSATENDDYSSGISCEATTICRILDTFFEDFEDGFSICLEQEYITGNSPWVIGKGNGGSFPNYAYQGEYNIFLTFNTLSDLGNETLIIFPPVDMDGFNNVNLSFAFHNQSRSVAIDELTIYYKISESKTWEPWVVYKTNQDTWRLDTIILPENVDTKEIQIAFGGKILGGHGICIDIISLEAFFNNVGIDEMGLNTKIDIYPNPTTGELKIGNGQLRIDDVEIFDIYGRKQLAESRKQLAEKEIIVDIFHLTAGIYFVKIKTEKSMQIEKIIKL